MTAERYERGPRMARDTHTVAIVGGGYPAVWPLARAISHRIPELHDWAPTIAHVLGVPLPNTEGHDRLAGATRFG